MRSLAFLFLIAYPLAAADEPAGPKVSQVVRGEAEKPQEFTLKAGEHSIELEVPLEAKLNTTSPAVYWEKCTELSCEYYPRGTKCVIVPQAPGRFYFTASAGGKASHFVVIQPDGVAPPPKPVTPPPVTPDIPPAPSELQKRIQAAYTADTGANKAKELADLVELFGQAQTFADSTDVTTVKSLAAKVGNAAKALIPAADLVGVKNVINAEMKTLFPAGTAETPLTPALRKDAAAKFKTIHEALKGVK